MRRCRLVLCFVAMLAWIAPLSAAALNVAFSGTIEFVQDDGISDGSVTVGTPFGGSVNVDSSAVDLDPSPTQGVYAFDAPTWSISAVMGPFIVFTVPPAGIADSSLRVTFENDSPSDSLNVEGLAVDFLGPVSQSIEGVSLQLSLQDSTGSALSSDAYDPSAFTLAPWSEASFTFELHTADGRSFSAGGTLDRFEVVPEPDGLTLVSVGSVALALLSRFRR
jgi:hypothetical protein